MNIFLEKFVIEKFEKPGISLDLGCGKGFDVACLKHLGWKALGIDKEDADLNKPYNSGKKFDLVYSNYVIQFINNKKIFIISCSENLKNDGWLFLHTFSKRDPIFKDKGINREEIVNLLKEYFKNIKVKEIKAYDNNFGHKHWHRILEISAQKK
jgi:SAM-dependent methyltransferase